MERLTMIDGCGNYELARCMDCGLEKAGADLENCGMCEEGWQRALKRLAAYEDTGLEPEEIKNALGVPMTNAARIRAMSDKELAKFLYDFFWGRKEQVRLFNLEKWLQMPSEEKEHDRRTEIKH